MWQWTLENMPQGLQVDGTGRYAVISVSKRGGNVEEQLHGVSVFDLTAEGGGLSKYLYTYRTEGTAPLRYYRYQCGWTVHCAHRNADHDAR